MIDRLRQLAIFAKTIDHGSFRGAARELNLSPSVVSHHISELEAQLGVALIYRSTRKLTLSPQGRRLLAAAQNMINAVEGELQDISATAKEPSGKVAITIPSVLSQSEFSDRIVAFVTRYPRVDLSLDFSDSRRGLIEDGFDIAIRMGFDAKTSASSRKLYKVHRKLVASVEYLKAREPIERPEDLENWDWLSLGHVHHASLQFTRSPQEQAVLRIQPKVQTNDAHALYRLARCGAGLAIVPDFLAQSDIESGIVRHVLPEWTLPAIEVFAEWPVNAPRHGLIHLALDVLSK